MDNIKKRIKPKGHYINNRKYELVIGLILFFVGAMLLWDAYNGRGKDAPWPFGAILPF